MIVAIHRFLHSRLFLWIRLIQFAVAITIFTVMALMPGNYVPEVSSDRSLHFLGNVLLMLSACVALFGRLKLGLLVFFLIPYSLLIELGQWLAPGRHVDLNDMTANILGLMAGYCIAHVTEWCWGKLKQNTALHK